MEKDEKQFYAERLDALWGRYISFVNFVVTISGGTVLILITKLIDLRLELDESIEVDWKLWIALISAIIAAIYAIFWRTLSQHYMEFEILAPFHTMNSYMGDDKVANSVTNVYAFSPKSTAKLKILYQLSPYVITPTIFISWLFIVWLAPLKLVHKLC